MGLTDSGLAKLEWAAARMPVLGRVRRGFERDRPFQGLEVAMCLHVEAKTGCLALAVVAGGARVRVCASNPLSTQDDVVEALRSFGMEVFARRGESEQEYRAALDAVLGEAGADLLVDDGADLVSALVSERPGLVGRVIGACEETTTGVNRLRAMDRKGSLPFPVIAVNDARSKHLFDNRFGSGQSVWDGIMRSTNVLVAGKTVVVAGYGWCGQGIAQRAVGLGARVVVCEVDPIRAAEAIMQGYQVMPSHEAAAVGDIFVTATGCSRVLSVGHFRVMRDGAILANAGHFDVEVDVAALASECAGRRRTVRPNVEEFVMPSGRKLYLLAQGRLVNLGAADGHPIEIMDLSFALQALCLGHLATAATGPPGPGGPRGPRGVVCVPASIDRSVAEMKLEALGVRIDALTAEQIDYLGGGDGGNGGNGGDGGNGGVGGGRPACDL